MKYNNILDSIGNTPLVKLNYFSTAQAQIFAKLEGNNPGGSVKDRIALSMINQAEKSGILDKDKVIIESTSGNTGIGLAMVAVVKGYKFVAVMSESASIERRKLLKAYGAEIILTDPTKGPNFAIDTARSIASEKNNYIILDQYRNEANVNAHYVTTGVEITYDMPEINYFVGGMGTGGTLRGVNKRLKEYNNQIKVIGIQPKAGSKIQGLRNMMAYKPEIFNIEKLDNNLLIEDDEAAFELSREIFKREGISVGMSSGAALWGVLELLKKGHIGKFVVLFPDRGDKYLSTELFT